MSAIDIHRIAKSFDGIPAVRDISFAAAQGDLTVLLGPSGCGKSTTLRLIAGLETVDSGRIEIAGRDVTHLPADQRSIAMVFQSYALFPHLSVAENIVFGLRVRKVPRTERDERLRRVAALVELTPYLDRKPSRLSGGQRQRVALARAIIAEQPVCLMDEPLSNLDAQLRHEMRIEIRALQKRLGITMVYVTHDQTEAMTMADKVILMKDGLIEQAAPPDILYERPASTFAARFIGAPAMNLLDDEAAVTGWIRGVRPEHVQIVRPGRSPAAASSSGCNARVTSVEYLGADSIVLARTAEGSPLSIRLSGRAGVEAGDAVQLAWEPQHEHRFHRETGQRDDRPVAATATSPTRPNAPKIAVL